MFFGLGLMFIYGIAGGFVESELLGVLGYIWRKTGLRKFYHTRILKRVPFCHKHVSTSWNIADAGIAHYALRLYREVMLLEKTLDGLKVERSLELGCGYGRLTPWIKEHSEQHFAVEPEESLLKDAKTLNPQVKFHNAKAQKLPFAEEFFDLIVTWTVLQHIPPNELAEAIKELKRVAKKQGVFIITEGTSAYKGETEWFYSIEEWKKMFYPWKLTKHFGRVLEETAAPDQGTVMRYERK
jgi:SAM-dependent methyltransferase